MSVSLTQWWPIRLPWTLVFASITYAVATPSSLLGIAIQAQEKAVPVALRAVESFAFNGQTVVGIIWTESESTISIISERDWVKQNLAGQYDRFLKQEADRLNPILETYSTRFDHWIDEFDDKPNLEALALDLKAERDRILNENRGLDLQKKKFIQLSFDRKSVTGIKRLPIQRKRIAGLAWEFNLDNVSSRSANDLKKELQSKKVDLNEGLFDLSVELPATELNDRQWSIRKAIYEFSFTGEVEFQGEADQLFRVSENADVNQILTKMLAGNQLNSLNQLGRELGLPEFSQTPQRDWMSEVTKVANEEGHRCILVKRIVPTQDADRVTVEASLIVKLGEQRWEKIANVGGESKLSEQTDDQLNVVREDPRVKSALNAVAKLGIGGNANLLDQAIRKGAATSAATRIASEKIQQIIAQNARLESPWMID